MGGMANFRAELGGKWARLYYATAQYFGQLEIETNKFMKFIKLKVSANFSEQLMRLNLFKNRIKNGMQQYILYYCNSNMN